MTVLIFGAFGWLGGRFARHFERLGHRVVKSAADITDADAVTRDLWGCDPDLVVNAAGRTHSRKIPNVDACIASAQAMRQTIASNTIGAGIVADVAYGRRLVHLSSGCIFDGPGIFTEQSQPNPPNFYAETKLLGERLVLAASSHALILRIRMPISAEPHSRNLITKLARAQRIVNVENSVTVIEDLLEFTDALVAGGATGIVHAVHPEPVTFRKLVGWYRELVDPRIMPTFVPKEEYQTMDGRSNAIVVSARTDLPAAMPPTALAVRRALTAYAGVPA